MDEVAVFSMLYFRKFRK